MPAARILPGSPYQGGATWDGTGVNFAIYSENATRVELCLFDDVNTPDHDKIEVTECTGHVWHCYVQGLSIGQLYGYRIHGPYEPEKGFRFNPAKLLIDPYATAVAGEVNWDYPAFGYQLDGDTADLIIDTRDDAAGIPKAVVTSSQFDWQNDRSPATPLHESIIYEAHVKGMTMCNPDVPEQIRGTYLGLVNDSMIDYFKGLGITAIELLPVHDFLNDRSFVQNGLRNYWGYNTTSFFAPTARYCSSGDRGQQIGEFKTMVREFHRAGIEVILDVVYNHTSEGNQLGPTISFKGVDNTTYYRLTSDNPRYYTDYTGTGNTLNMRHPQVLKMVMDSLRYWVLEMHVDGFRFDLASTLARELHDVDRLSSFFDVINQDPVLSRVKLIAEPWDVGEGGYQVGRFPALWAEWNGKYRDVVRKYWKGDDGQLEELGYRLTGSSDLYQHDGRRPSASINFVTAHDGFTLNDLVSYDSKHNEANQEDNRDGSNDNHSWNHGVEGATDDQGILDFREREKRNFLVTLLLSQGVPMLCGGDEIGRTQRGNNNAYAQDNDISWFDWNLDQRRKDLLEFTSQLIQLRKEHPNLHRRRFFQDRKISPADEPKFQIGSEQIRDICWYRPDGHEMTDEEWKAGWVRCLGLWLSGKTINDVDRRGEMLRDDTFLLCLNPHHDHIQFYLPQCDASCQWEKVFDTRDSKCCEPTPIGSGNPYDMIEHSAVLFREVEAATESDKEHEERVRSAHSVELQHETKPASV